jgi:type II secretory pathway component GspD/PulD (secretin)
LTTETLQSQSGNQTTQGDEITQVTVGTILTITPQISADNWISLDISPVLTSLVAVEKSPSGTATAPVLDTKQASTLIRVRDGTTIILGGLIQNQRGRNQRKVPLLGDIPILGRVFTGKFDLKVKKELVIFITPKVVREDELSVPQVSVLATPEPKPKGRTTTPQPSLDVQERQ